MSTKVKTTEVYFWSAQNYSVHWFCRNHFTGTKANPRHKNRPFTELKNDAVYTCFQYVKAYLPLQCHHQTATKSHGSSQWWYNGRDLDHCHRKKREGSNTHHSAYEGKFAVCPHDPSYYWHRWIFQLSVLSTRTHNTNLYIFPSYLN